jgi:hypothetical protein
MTTVVADRLFDQAELEHIERALRNTFDELEHLRRECHSYGIDPRGHEKVIGEIGDLIGKTEGAIAQLAENSQGGES